MSNRAIDWQTAAAFGDATALTANFLDGGTIAPPSVKAPVKTAAMLATEKRQAAAKAAADAQRRKEQVQTANALTRNEQLRQQKISDAIRDQLMRTDPKYAAAYKKQHSAGVDWGLIPMGAKVLATGAAVIASGGAVAGALGVTAAGSTIAGAAAADRLIAAAEKGGQIAADAKKTIGSVKQLAAAGDVGAKLQAAILDKVEADRRLKGVVKGAEQKLSDAGKKALSELESAVKLPGAAAVVKAVADVAPKPKPAPVPAPKPIAARPSPAPAPLVKQRIDVAPIVKVVWFVSESGKVTPGSIALGKGWRVYSNGKVVQQ